MTTRYTLNLEFFLLLLVDIAGLSGFLLLVHIAGLSGGAVTKDCFFFDVLFVFFDVLFAFFAFTFPSAFSSLFIFSTAWEEAGSMDSGSSWLETPWLHYKQLCSYMKRNSDLHYNKTY